MLLGLSIGLSACQQPINHPTHTQPVVTLPQQGASVMVIKDSGVKQCSDSPSKPLEKAQQQLKSAHISADSGHCARRIGVSYMAVCGATAGLYSAFQIPQSHLDQAKQLGFEAVDAQAIEIVACPHH